MKRLAIVLIVLLALAATARAGSWSIGGTVRLGGGKGYHGGGIIFSGGRHGGFHGGFHGGGIVIHLGDHISVVWGGFGRWGHHGIRRFPACYGYYGTPYYMLRPWYWYDGADIIRARAGAGDALFDDERIVRPAGDVFLVPVSGAPAAQAEKLPDINAPIPQVAPADGTAPPGDTEGPGDAALANLRRLVTKGDLAGAEDVLLKKLKREPSDAQLNYLYAYVLFRREKFSTAAFVLRRGIAIDPSLLESVPDLVGRIAPREGKGSDLAAINAQLAARGDDASAWLIRAFIRYLDGDRAAAREDLSVILADGRTDPQAAGLLAVCSE